MKRLINALHVQTEALSSALYIPAFIRLFRLVFQFGMTFWDLKFGAWCGVLKCGIWGAYHLRKLPGWKFSA